MLRIYCNLYVKKNRQNESEKKFGTKARLRRTIEVHRVVWPES